MIERPHRFALGALLLWIPSCSTAPEMGEEAGRGMVAADVSAPVGTETFDCPTWQEGTRIDLRRAGVQDYSLVVEAQETGYALVSETGQRLHKSSDLADLGEDGDPEMVQRAYRPADFQYHWPLWEGKRWRCEFVEHVAGRGAMGFEARYHVEGRDRITVPAGTFDTLRIHRTQVIQLEGAYTQRHSVTWYSPELGLEVRALIDGALTELVGYELPERGE